jgi:nitrate/nitrite transporter NarK
VLGSLAAGALLTASFIAWELRARQPMLPMRFFQERTFAATNVVSFVMYLGLFGSAFLLSQYLQIAHGYSPLQAGLRTLPWTAMPLLIAPVAGALSDRIGGRPLMIAGLSLQAGALAGIAAIASPTVPYGELAIAFAVAGIGMALVFAPVTNVVLGAVRPHEAGQASGANNAIRELGGVFGVAVLASVFSRAGAYASPAVFVDGFRAALWAGVIFAVAGVMFTTAGLKRVRQARQPASPGPDLQPISEGQPSGHRR